MNVLMISIDKGLLGENPLGDVIERHKKYANQVTRLDIIVLNKRGFTPNRLQDNLYVYPGKLFSIFTAVADTIRVATKLYKKNKYDLIVTQDPFLTGYAGLQLKKKYGSKVLIHLHGDYIDGTEWLHQRKLNRILEKLAYYTLHRADGIRVVSKGIENKLLKRGFPKNKIRVIPTPVNINRFQKGVAQNKPWKYVITMVGRLDPIKDYETLFAAMKKVFAVRSDVGLYLIGNYTSFTNVPLPKDRIRLLGSISTEQLPDMYATSDVVVLTSISESFGKVIVEAQAAGKPVVSTDTVGASEIIENGKTGFLVPVGNAEEIAKKVCMLLDDRQLASRMGNAGMQRITSHFADTTRSIIKFWNDLVSDTI